MNREYVMPAEVVGTLLDVLGCAALTLLLAYCFGGFGVGGIDPLVDRIIRRCGWESGGDRR